MLITLRPNGPESSNSRGGNVVRPLFFCEFACESVNVNNLIHQIEVFYVYIATHLFVYFFNFPHSSSICYITNLLLYDKE